MPPGPTPAHSRIEPRSLSRKRKVHLNPVALVTGGAVRLGRAITLGLAEAGYDLAINYHSSAGPAEELQRRLSKLGRDALLVPGDVSDADDVRNIAERIRGRFGRLDLLVNSASVFRKAALLSLDESEWDRVMAVNLRGPFLTVRETADMLEASRGSVVNIVDLSAFQPWAEYPHHSVSKAGLLHLTRVMARTLAPHVRVNAIAPGAVLIPDDYTAEDAERSRKRSLLGSLGSPDDVVRTVLFLARSPYITGEVIAVDGGRLQNP